MKSGTVSDANGARWVRGGLASIAVKAGQIASAFLVTVVLARALGPEGLGVYAFAYAVIVVFAVPVQAGLPQLVLRETARAVVREEWGLLQGLWRWSERVVLVLALAVVAVVAMSLLLWPTSLEDGRMRTLLAGLLVLPLLALGNLRGAALRGLAHPALGQLPEAVVRPVVLAGGVALAAAWSGKPVGPVSAMLLLAAASAIAWLLGRGLLRRRRPAELTRAVVPEYRGRAWFTAAASLGLVAALQLVLGQTDVLMLGLLRSDEEVGIYRVAVQLSLLVGLGLEVAHMVTAPWVARYGVDGRLAELERLMKRASRAVFAAATLVLLVLVVVGEQLLALCFGAVFVGAQLPMVLLGVGRLLAGGFGPVGMVLQMTGFERATVLGVGLAAATNVVLNMVLIPTFGSAGAATATGAALVLSHLVLHRLVVQRLGIDASIAPGVRLRAVSRETG